MFGLGTTEILFICLLALIFFKAEDLPKVARTVGRFLNEIRRGSEDFQSQLLEADKFANKVNEKLHDPLFDQIEKKILEKTSESPNSSESSTSHPNLQTSSSSEPDLYQPTLEESSQKNDSDKKG